MNLEWDTGPVGRIVNASRIRMPVSLSDTRRRRLNDKPWRTRCSPVSAPAFELPHPIPEGALLLHVGPPKTASTFVQGAFHAARPALREQGVRYAGSRRHSKRALHAVRNVPWNGGAPPPIKAWQALVHDTHDPDAKRVVLSSEELAKAGAEVIRRVVDDLGPDRVYVGMTLRPLIRVLPSTWQQRVQAGLRTPFEAWLEEILHEPDCDPTSIMYWHRHDRLIARWAQVVGPDRIRTIVLDGSDQGQVLRVFEALVGLRTGTLRAHRDMANRSFTWPEAEAVRSLNLALGQSGVDPRLGRQVRRDMVRKLKREDAPPSWPPVEVPPSALERVLDVQGEIVEGIGAIGVPVVGRVEALRQPPAKRLDNQSRGDEVPAELLGRFGVALLVAASGVPRPRRRGLVGSRARKAIRDAPHGRLRLRVLADELVKTARRLVRRR